MFVEQNMNFMEDGVCKGKDPRDFFEHFEKSKKQDKEKFLIDNCYVCPVRNDCFEFAKSTRATGLWGGIFLENGKASRNTLGKGYLEMDRDREATIQADRLKADRKRARLPIAS